MSKILCSSGALIGRPNGSDFRLLQEIYPRLECDGLEFMVYSRWYPIFDDLVSFLNEIQKSMGIRIPVVHCQKALGETLCGMKAWFEEGNYGEYVMTEEEDRENFQRGLQEFELNLRLANAVGADRMVLHLWNGIPSDKNIDKNIERFGILDDTAQKAGVILMAENVVCNTKDPLYNLDLLHKAYPDASLVYDTKMAEFHEQTMQLFDPQWDWMLREGNIKHMHINDYSGGYMDWSNLKVLPIGEGHIDFDTFFEKLSHYNYEGDYTVEATSFDLKTGVINYDRLNKCFRDLRQLLTTYNLK